MSTFDETNVRRQPAGITGAGQFATKPKGETSIALPPATTPGQVEAELETLQAARESAQERWRSGRGRHAADHDVDVLSAHVLARDVLTQHPTATHLVLTTSDQVRDGMLALEALDADGNVLFYDDDQEDPTFEDLYSAASDMRQAGAWAEHAELVSEVGRGGDPEWRLDLRALVATAPVLAAGDNPLADGGAGARA